METSTQEMQWVLRAQCHDREALELLLRDVQPPLRRYLSGLAGTADADDLLQDVLMIIIRKLGSLENPAVFRAWAFRIASRQAFRHLKKRRLWHDRQDLETVLDDLPGSQIRQSGERLTALLATTTISPASRAVLMLHFQEDLPLPQVAAILDIPLGTAKSRLAYGLASIRKVWKDSGGHMAETNDDVVRRSLDAVDRHRTRLLIGLALGVVLLLFGFYHASGMVHAPANIFLHEVFVLLVIWTTLLALVVVIQITVMTKRILRAIELASKK